MTRYKYRIQIGDEYTYRDSSHALDMLVLALLDGADYERMLQAVERLEAKARGQDLPELPPPRPPVRAEDIRITVVMEPLKRNPEEDWHKVGE
jgi:hypothetical protein